MKRKRVCFLFDSFCFIRGGNVHVVITDIQADLPFNFGEMHRVSVKILSPFNADCGHVQQKISVQTH